MVMNLNLENTSRSGKGAEASSLMEDEEIEPSVWLWDDEKADKAGAETPARLCRWGLKMGIFVPCLQKMHSRALEGKAKSHCLS